MKSAIMLINHAHGLFVERPHDLDEAGWQDGRRAADEDIETRESSESSDSRASGRQAVLSRA
jgi:hypothetical protein